MCLHIFERKLLNPIKTSFGTGPVDCFSWKTTNVTLEGNFSCLLEMLVLPLLCSGYFSECVTTLWERSSTQANNFCHTITRLGKKKILFECENILPLLAVFSRCFSDIDPPTHFCLDLFTSTQVELKVHLVQTILGDCWNSGKMDQECSGECYFEWSVFYSDKVFLQMESATIQDYVAVMAAHVATASWSNLLDHFLNPLYIL